MGSAMESLTNSFDRMKISGLGRLRLRAPPSGGVFAIGVRGVAQPIPVTYQLPYGVTFAGGYKTYAVRPSRLDVSNRPRERWWGQYRNRHYPPLAWEWRSMLMSGRFDLSYSRRQDLAAIVDMDEHQLVSGIITQLRVWMRRAHKNLIKNWMAPQGRRFIAATSNLKRIPTKSRVNKRKLPDDFLNVRSVKT